MHMWMWFGYNLGDFLFPGLDVSTRWSFALTWIVLFFVAMLFEGSKVFLARVQREAIKKLYPLRSDERRNLLCEREQGGVMEPSTSRNTSAAPLSHWDSFKIRTLVNTQQSLVFVVHNVVGYLLMLAVMLYNVHLILAVVFGMTLGYFLFGTKLTRLQMQCYNTRKAVVCTPECDDNAESTPPLLDTASSSESDFFTCQTRTCIQPSHYFPANQIDGAGDHANATCYYGAKQCPSKVARMKKIQAQCHKNSQSNTEGTDLLQKERSSCCKETEAEISSQVESIAEVHPSKSCCKRKEEPEIQPREQSPQISCCHAKTASSDSQEQIVDPS